MITEGLDMDELARAVAAGRQLAPWWDEKQHGDMGRFIRGIYAAITDDKRQPLTDRQREVYEFLRGFMERNDGKAPSITEIAEHFDCGRSTVFSHLRQLRDRGWITTFAKIHRGLKLR